MNNAFPVFNLISWDWTLRGIAEEIQNVLFISWGLGIVLGLLIYKLPAKFLRHVLAAASILATSMVLLHLFAVPVVMQVPEYTSKIMLVSVGTSLILDMLVIAAMAPVITRFGGTDASNHGSGDDGGNQDSRAMEGRIIVGIITGSVVGLLIIPLVNFSITWKVVGTAIATVLAMVITWKSSMISSTTWLVESKKPERKRVARKNRARRPAIARHVFLIIGLLLLMMVGSVLVSISVGSVNTALGDYETVHAAFLYPLFTCIASLAIFWIARKYHKGQPVRGKSLMLGLVMALLAGAITATLRIMGSATGITLVLEEYSLKTIPPWLFTGLAGTIIMAFTLREVLLKTAMLNPKYVSCGMFICITVLFMIPGLIFSPDLARLFFSKVYGVYIDGAILLFSITAIIMLFLAKTQRKIERIEKKGKPTRRILSSGKTSSRKATAAILLVAVIISVVPISLSLPTYLDLPNRRPYSEYTPEWSAVFEPPQTNLTGPGIMPPPGWSVAEYKALNAYKEWVYFWMNNQRADGSYGGGFEDDVELIKTFPVLTFITGDQAINESVSKLAEGVWRSGMIQDGFTNRNPYFSDVEHMAEPVSYTTPMMLLLHPNDAKWLQRAYETAVHFGMDWTMVNEVGHRHVRGHYFNAYDFDRRPGRDTENAENGRAIKQAIITAWHDHSPELIRWLHEWATAMAHHANQTSDNPSNPLYGKPVGFIPSEIDPITDEAGYYTGNWYQAFYKRLGHVSYGWTKGFNGVRQQVDSVLAIGALTGDAFILDMIGKMFQYLLENQTVNGVPANEPDLDDDDELQFDVNGTVLWEDAAEMRMPNSALIWQKVTGNTSLNALLHEWGKAMVLGMRDSLGEPWSFGNITTDNFDRATARYEGDDPEAMGPAGYLAWWYGNRTNKTLAVHSLEGVAEDLRQQWPDVTWNAVREKDDREIIGYTDHRAQRVEPNGEMLSWFATGGIGSCEARYPYMPVSYENSDYNITPLVVDENATHLHVLFYNFNDINREITLNFWQLNNGNYTLAGGIDGDLDDTADSIDQTETFTVGGRNTKVNITLPPRAVYSLTVTPDGVTMVPDVTPEHEPAIFKDLYNSTRVRVNGRLFDSHDSPMDTRAWAFLNRTGGTVLVYFKAKRFKDVKLVNVKLSGVDIISAEEIDMYDLSGAPVSVKAGEARRVRVDYSLRGIKFTIDPGSIPVDVEDIAVQVSRPFLAPVSLIPIATLIGLVFVEFLLIFRRWRENSGGR
ncbi:hypothetical protein GF325_18895 [Candidatus Bathyarchaeota archaeon]|nr:hypothetical protein [Candidatus Bathyarchaeota archaeon]